MKNKFVCTAILIAGLTLVSFQTNHLYGQTLQSSMEKKDTTMKYSCPHHPDSVSNKPGKCTCGMELVAMKDSNKISKKLKAKKR
jgi:hypothetical protein